MSSNSSNMSFDNVTSLHNSEARLKSSFETSSSKTRNVIIETREEPTNEITELNLLRRGV